MKISKRSQFFIGLVVTLFISVLSYRDFLFDAYISKDYKFFDESTEPTNEYYLIDRAIMLNYYALKFYQSITNTKHPKCNIDYYNVSLNLIEKYYLVQFFKCLPKDAFSLMLMITGEADAIKNYTSNPYYKFSFLKTGKKLWQEEKESKYTGPGLYIMHYCLIYLQEWMYKSLPILGKFIALNTTGDEYSVLGMQYYFCKFFEYCIKENLPKLKDVAKILDKRPDNEICGFWYCIYDGPHPSNFRDIHDALYNEFIKYNPRVANLMKSTFEKMLLDTERCCPCH